MTYNFEKFDERVEMFLKKKMNAEEEQEFLSELKNDEKLLRRAQTISLMIQQMNEAKIEQGERVIEMISSTDEKTFIEEIEKSPHLEEFDEMLERFLKSKMTAEEESEFIQLLNDNKLLRERAQAMALMIQQMKEIRKEADASTEDYKTENLKPEGKALNFGKKWIGYAAAACVIGLLFIGGYKMHKLYEADRLGEKYAGYNQTGMMRGEDEYLEVKDSLEEVVDSVVEEQINTPEKTEKDDEPTIDFKALLADVAAGKNLKNASSIFDSLYVVATGDEYNQYSNYANDIGWGAAIAYLRRNKLEKAKDILMKIKNENKGKEIADRAEELIKEINKL